MQESVDFMQHIQEFFTANATKNIICCGGFLTAGKIPRHFDVGAASPKAIQADYSALVLFLRESCVVVVS